ncbi:hypothetical protein GCM10023213_42360 [Prosthecobacter algae]|uniref:Uncharacterized protein n=1 Tax=Prosthecobacter algae TaxID=1144682 RepID=A0ABP9PN08_9BACT
MKIALLPFALLALSVSSVNAAVPGSVANVTFALTLTNSTPGTVFKDSRGVPVKDPVTKPAYINQWVIANDAAKTVVSNYEDISKMKTVKFGNKELLTELVDQGILPEYGDKAPYIAGWTIVSVNASGFANEFGEGFQQYPSKFYAVHKAEGDIVDLSNHIDYSFGSDYAETSTYKTVEKFINYNTPQQSTTLSLTNTSNWKETVYYEIDFEGFNSGATVTALLDGFEFAGVSAIGNKQTSIGVGLEKMDVFVDTAGKTASISGAGPRIEEDGDRAVVEGSISFSAGKVEADVTVYPNLQTAPTPDPVNPLE